MPEVTDQLNRIEEDIRIIKVLMTGNGTPEKGLVLRVDRLEQDAQRHTFWSRTALAAAVTTAVGAILKLLFGH